MLRIVPLVLVGIVAVSSCRSNRALIADGDGSGAGGTGGAGGKSGAAGAQTTGSGGSGVGAAGMGGEAGAADAADATTDGGDRDVAPDAAPDAPDAAGGDVAFDAPTDQPDAAGDALPLPVTGDVFGDRFNTTGSDKAILDGAPSGPTNLAYPLNHTLFPPNLSPSYAHIQIAGGRIARLAFRATGVDLTYYDVCENLAGGGCFVKMPLTLTRRFVAASEVEDIQLTARVSSGGAPVETQTINVAWAGLELSGGLYYWSPILNPPKKIDTSNVPTPPNYVLLDPSQTGGTAVLRYAFSADGTDPTPALVWTDDGGPASTPPFGGAPQAFVNGTAGSHCIGCHAVSNDGKYMALTLGGSAATDGANFALLDVGMQALIDINPTASTDPQSSPTSNPTDYWKKFRLEGLATESSWGPQGDRLVSMFQSKLYLTQVAVNGTTGTVTRTGAVVPTWQAREAYASDPFWSRDGTLFVFTSFAQPSVGLYNDTGLNGDEKKGGQIVLATADANGVHDDARVLVGRGSGITAYGPSTSDDSALVIFDTSTCGSDPDSNKSATDYGNQSCDGYDDSTAKLWLVSSTGGASSELSRANGAGAFGNAWPRFGPRHGAFRGQTLYWVVFSSRRPYGLQINSGVSAIAARPQLWLAGVTTGGALSGDPSFAPVWLPGQNANVSVPTGNHTPQWVAGAVPIP